MARVDVQSVLTVYEVDGDEVSDGSIAVVSHWTRGDFVVLSISGRTYTVVGNDLAVAVENAMRTGGV